MLRLALMALLATTTCAAAQMPTTVFNTQTGTITTITPTPGGGFTATDSRGGMAIGQGNMVTVTPAPQMQRIQPMQPMPMMRPLFGN